MAQTKSGSLLPSNRQNIWKMAGLSAMFDLLWRFILNSEINISEIIAWRQCACDD